MSYVDWYFFFFSSRRRHTRLVSDWSSDVCSSDLAICSTNFIAKLTNEHEVKAFDEFSHVDFYWKPEAVKASCDAVAEFFKK